MITQWNRIVSHCMQNGSITVRDALLMGINSQRKRISELRKSGHYDVKTVVEEGQDRYGCKTKYNRYFIRPLDGEAGQSASGRGSVVHHSG